MVRIESASSFNGAANERGDGAEVTAPPPSLSGEITPQITTKRKERAYVYQQNHKGGRPEGG